MDGPEDSRNLRDLIQTAQRIQAEVTRIKDELSSKTTAGESGGGLVRCTVSGTGELLELSIDPNLPNLPNLPTGATLPDFGGLDKPQNLRMLEELIIGAVNVALARARELARQEMSQVTGGMPMPPGTFGG
jgi:hypothetical protein